LIERWRRKRIAAVWSIRTVDTTDINTRSLSLASVDPHQHGALRVTSVYEPTAAFTILWSRPSSSPVVVHGCRPPVPVTSIAVATTRVSIRLPLIPTGFAYETTESTIRS
jgi:hypothetical protein